jgi:hypothetical protein
MRTPIKCSLVYFGLLVLLATGLPSVAEAQVRRGGGASESHPRLDYDLGASAGSTTKNGETRQYQEAQMGLNLHLTSWLNWRNSLWGRRMTATEDIYGLDTGLRLQAGLEGESLAIRLLGGGGYRFQNTGKGAPFAEAGLGLRVGALNISAGAKRIYRQAVDPEEQDETQYFLTVSGALRGQL